MLGAALRNKSVSDSLVKNSMNSNDFLVKVYRLCADGQTQAAMQLCLPKAETGDIGCARLVGWIYSIGGGSINKDLDEAKRWLTLASGNGDPLATYLLGIVAFEQGDMEAAMARFRKAGDEGVSAGLYQLAKLYELGAGVDKDEAQAYDYYRESASMGHVFARRRVAGMLLGGYKGFFGRLIGIPMLLLAIVLGAYTAVIDPYGEKTYE